MSRYYDYDYDRNCIIGFGSDEDGLSNTLTKSQSRQSLTNMSDITQSPASSVTHTFQSPSPPSSPSHSTIAHEHQYYFGMTMEKEIDTCSSHSGLLQDDIIEYDPCDDEMYILEADLKDIKQQKLIPLKTEVPFLLVADMLKQQEILHEIVLHQTHIHQRQQLNCNTNVQMNGSLDVANVNNAISLGFGDKIDAMKTDKNLWIQRGLNCVDGTIQNPVLNQPPQIVQCEQMKRFDDYNGAYYNCFGSKIVNNNQCHIWRLQLLGNSPCIIGIIESDAKLQTRGGYFGCDTGKILSYSYNTITAKTYSSSDKSLQPIYQQMLQSGRLDKPMIIDMKLDLINGTMTIANKTSGCQHYGKEIPLFNNIDTTKAYKLGIALLGPETINLF